MRWIGATLAMLIGCAIMVGRAAAQTTASPSIDEIGANPALDMRLRYEVFDPTAFGRGPQDGDGYWLWRIAPSVRVPLSGSWTVGGQLFAAGVVGRNGGARPVDRNDFDLTQAWAEWRSPRSKDVFIRIGRQEIALGSGRLLAASDSSNTRRRFDGVTAQARLGEATLIGVAASPVTVRPGVFDDASTNKSTVIGGGFLFKPAKDVQIAAYLVSSRRGEPGFGAPGGSKRTTAGVRWLSKHGPYAVELEVLGQDGSAGAFATSGWAIAGEFSRTFAPVGTATPRLWLKASAASGDDNPDDLALGRFDPLFANPTYSGSIPLFGPTNLAAINPGVTLTWADGARIGLDVAVMARVDADDTAWTFAGLPIAAQATPDRSVGALWAVTGLRPIRGGVSLGFTAAYFDAARSFAPPEADTRFFAVNLNLAL